MGTSGDLALLPFSLLDLLIGTFLDRRFLISNAIFSGLDLLSPASSRFLLTFLELEIFR